MTPRVVVDASVLVASLMADGRARHALLHSPSALFVPSWVFEELEKNVPKIAARARVDRGVIDSLIADIHRRVEILSEATLTPFRTQAIAACKAASAEGDEEYVAAALALDAPIWTYDRDFARVRGVRTVGTAEIASDDSVGEVH